VPPFFRQRDLWFLWLSFLILSAICTAVPLLRAVDYPLSLVASPLSVLVAGLLGIMEPRDRPVWRGLGRFALALLAGLSLLLVGPVLGAMVTATFCEPAYGLLFLLMGPFGSGILAYALGRLLGWMLRWRWAIPVFLGFVGITPVLALLQFFLTPMIRFYGSFWGLYHGAIYDEAVFVTGPYLALRSWNMLAVAAMLLWVDFRQGSSTMTLSRALKNRKYAAKLAFGGVIVVLWLGMAGAGPWLGFIASGERLRSTLSGKLQTGHFEIHYNPGGRSVSLVPLFARDLEFRHDQIQQFFALPETDDSIHVWLYDSPQQKAQLMGAGRTSIAKPWLHQIHVHTRDVGGALIAHELAHVMLGPVSGAWLAMPVDGWGRPRPGILEGAAVAVERGAGILTTHQWARAMRDAGFQPDMGAILESLSFWGQASGRAYTACGSFIRFLVESYGPAPFKLLYGGAAFEAAYGQSVDKLLVEWNEFLDGQSLPPESLAVAEYIFARPPVFEKVCPYAGGRCLQRARRAVMQNNPEAAVAYSAQALTMTRGDLYLGQQLVRLLYAAGAVDDGLLLLDAVGRKHQPAPGSVTADILRLALADGLWLTGEAEAADTLYATLSTTPFARWTEEVLPLRGEVVAKLPQGDYVELVVGAVPGFKLPDVHSRLLREPPDKPAQQLVLGLTLARWPEHHGLAVLNLLAALKKGYAPAVEQKIRETLVKTCFWLKRYPEAEQWLSMTTTGVPTEAEREWNLDWQQRFRWARNREAAAGN
jgi:hypothetical protein